MMVIWWMSVLWFPARSKSFTWLLLATQSVSLFVRPFVHTCLCLKSIQLSNPATTDSTGPLARLLYTCCCCAVSTFPSSTVSTTTTSMMSLPCAACICCCCLPPHPYLYRPAWLSQSGQLTTTATASTDSAAITNAFFET